MFEMIGLLFATAFLLGLAGALGAAFAGLVWLLTKKVRRTPRIVLIVAAILVPLLSAVYFWVCVAVLPGESLFGDISEPLPNGYVVEALGKMPDYGGIRNPESPRKYPHLTGYIGKVTVDGPFVVGQYSHPFLANSANPVETYFIFDTHSVQTTEVQTLSGLQAKLGHPVQLTEVQLFRSPLAAARRRTNREIMFVPPFLALLFLGTFVWLARSRAKTDASGIDI